MTRRLAAILAADVVGYSGLMEIDEVGTLAALKDHREQLINPLISEHNGRIVKLIGDGVLVEFGSVVDAVTCALAIQAGMAGRNANVTENRRIVFRVAVHLGDVIIEGDDLYGDGINVAARLEGLAEPGGICISQQALDQVETKLALAYEDIGEQQVKNITRPIHAYRVRSEHKARQRSTTVQRGVRASYAFGLAVAAVLIVVGIIVAWWQPWMPEVKPASVELMAFPLPDKPSIAVLPFTNMSSDPSQEYFADGITEDLITDLSKVSGLFVIARNSTFAYKGRSLDVKQVAEELGIRYILEGSVRRAGDQVRINAQLIDTATGGHLWAERYDGGLGDVFGLQDRITRKIVGVLAVQLTAGEEAAAALRETENAESYDVFLKGWEQYLRQTPEGFREAIAQFEKAIKLDANYSRAYAALSATYWQVFKRHWHSKLGLTHVHDARIKAEELLEKAKRNPTALSHQVAAAMLSQQGRHTEAIAEGGQAIGVDPNDADSYVALASALNLAGNPEEGLQLMKKAMRLNPHFPPYYLYEVGLAQFGIGDFQSAAATLEKATAFNPEDRWSYRLLLATYGHLDRGADAKRILDVMEKNWRGYDPISIRAIAFWYPFKIAEDRERLATGLRKANVPD